MQNLVGQMLRERRPPGEVRLRAIVRDERQE
jgi:hypothetical protein